MAISKQMCTTVHICLLIAIKTAVSWEKAGCWCHWGHQHTHLYPYVWLFVHLSYNIVRMRSLLWAFMTVTRSVVNVMQSFVSRDHSFPRTVEFRAEPRNLPFSAEFWYCRGILWYFTEVKEWPPISTIVGFRLTISRRKIKLNCLKLRPY